ncbi:DegT/DnrJ/EryC1/StrS family aminotransferase [Novispirillum itersonii]|uniref:DegT/DnrJ/EryC1/StrS family aminotransferase n=1 Tax=Novispirillum itersonii TaxID=189 RepID=UPI0003760BAA|nr:DegT/DnrJ/EryC1/StrS family aminotransferase [Novispirillum itersonii]
MSKAVAIGGFLPLELPLGTGGLLKAWTAGCPFAAFRNARSALAALISQLSPPRVWLPAFICVAVTEGVPFSLRHYYRLNANLSPDVEDLKQAQPGDMILGVNYFGYQPDQAFLNFVTGRPDITFVEDCAHCVLPDEEAWGDWRLFSPRKVIGVADGGILVAKHSKCPPPQPTDNPRDADALWRAPLLRYEDEMQENSSIWHPDNQAKETAMTVDRTKMTRLTMAALALLEPESIAKKRRRNFAILKENIGEFLLPQSRSTKETPFCFPIRLPPDQRDRVLRHLHADKIFAAVHWTSLPVASAEFPEAHLLSQSLISLPCDQRYDADQMRSVATSLRQAL